MAPLRLTLLGAALAACTSASFAQTCSGPLPKPRDVLGAPATGEKFRMIASQCDVLDDPATVQRSPHLDLYDRRSVHVQMEPKEPAAAPAPAPAPVRPATPATPLPPPSKGEQRVLAIAPTLMQTAREFNLDPLFLHAIAHVESRHNPDAVSHAGARGVMQVMPATGKRFGVGDAQRLHDAETNIRASAALLRTLHDRYRDDPRLILAAYNAGEGAVEKFGRDIPPYPETQDYVRKVLEVHRKLQAEFTVSAEGNLIAKRGRP